MFKKLILKLMQKYQEVFFVGATDKLPPPLSKEDELAYLIKDKNIKLATYASRCIANEILMFIRKNKKRKNEVSFDSALSYDVEGNELHLEDVLGTEDDLVPNEYEKKVDKESLEKEINVLDSRDKEIMTLRYGLGNTKEYTQK